MKLEEIKLRVAAEAKQREQAAGNCDLDDGGGERAEEIGDGGAQVNSGEARSCRCEMQQS